MVSKLLLTLLSRRDGAAHHLHDSGEQQRSLGEHRRRSHWQNTLFVGDPLGARSFTQQSPLHTQSRDNLLLSPNPFSPVCVRLEGHVGTSPVRRNNADWGGRGVSLPDTARPCGFHLRCLAGVCRSLSRHLRWDCHTPVPLSLRFLLGWY